MRGRGAKAVKKLKEPGALRRIETLRVKLGLSDSNLGFMFGMDQYQVGRIITGEKPKNLTADMVETFALYLSQPDKMPDKMPDSETISIKRTPPPLAEPHSPALFDSEAMSEIARGILDPNLGQDEWDEKLSKQLWFLSKAPFKRSDYVSAWHWSLGRWIHVDDKSEVGVHGWDFVKAIRARFEEEVIQAAREDTVNLAAAYARSMLSRMDNRRERLGMVRKRPRDDADHVREWAIGEGLPVPLDSPQDSAMDFLARMFELATGDDGQLVMALLEEAQDDLKDYSDSMKVVANGKEV